MASFTEGVITGIIIGMLVFTPKGRRTVGKAAMTAGRVSSKFQKMLE